MTAATAAERFLVRLADANPKDNVLVAVTLAVTLLSSSGFYFCYHRRQSRQQQQQNPWPILPGAIPFLGHAHLSFPIQQIVTKWEAWSKAYASDSGCFEMSVLGRRFIIISSEERAMEILQHRPNLVIRPQQVKESMRSIVNYGIFSAEGDQWKREHKLVAPALNKANVNDYLITFKLMAHRLVQKWKYAAQNKEIVDIGPDLGNIAADTIAKASLDKDYDFLNSESQIGTDIRNVLFGFLARSMVPFRYWNIPVIGQYLDGLGWSIHRTSAMVDQVVVQYAKQGGDTSKKTFLQKIYTLMQSTKQSIPRHRLVGNVIGLFLAGTDSTSKTLTTAFYLLASDLELQETLRREADAVDLDSLSLQDLYIQIPRIKSFLHEVHRWYAVPAHGLYVTQDIPFCGITLSKGIDVIILTRAVSWQSSDVPMGPNGSLPNAFDPARYLVTGTDGKLSSIFPRTKLGGFLAFGHGVRSCPARVYSEGLSYAVLVHALQCLSWTLKPGHVKPPFIFDVVMTPDCNVELVFTKRDGIKA